MNNAYKLIIISILLLFTNPTLAADCGFPWMESEETTQEQEWEFIDCVHSDWDCRDRAYWCDYRYYKAEYRGYPCSSRVYMRFACYGMEKR